MPCSMAFNRSLSAVYISVESGMASQSKSPMITNGSSTPRLLCCCCCCGFWLGDEDADANKHGTIPWHIDVAGRGMLDWNDSVAATSNDSKTIRAGFTSMMRRVLGCRSLSLFRLVCIVHSFHQTCHFSTTRKKNLCLKYTERNWRRRSAKEQNRNRWRVRLVWNHGEKKKNHVSKIKCPAPFPSSWTECFVYETLPPLRMPWNLVCSMCRGSSCRCSIGSSVYTQEEATTFGGSQPETNTKHGERAPLRGTNGRPVFVFVFCFFLYGVYLEKTNGLH